MRFTLSSTVSRPESEHQTLQKLALQELTLQQALRAVFVALLVISAAVPTADAADSPHSTSPSSHPSADSPRHKGIDGDVLITFSEFPVDTPISNQYSDQGILFGGDSPFISPDGANPTSPVLSGSPRFQGAIEGTFVDPEDGSTPTLVSGFSLDAGFFDAIGSVRIEWYDLDGNKIGQRANSIHGIENFLIEGGSIASWRIEIVENEPAGFAIDNVSFDLGVASSVLFREKRDGDKDGTWGLGDDEVPGFDHVALHLDDAVYESHPGYGAGTYVSADGTESVAISQVDGAQSQHTRETFEHDARTGMPTPVIDFDEIAIPRQLAADMATLINQQISAGAPFQGINFDTPDLLEATLSPSAQKGGGGSFTCVGLVEWAAEQAGHNNGQGFINNKFESFLYPTLEIPPEIKEAPLLSPQLLNYTLKFSDKVNDVKQWFQGFFDPVDFMVTDPLGRRLGYTAVLGEVNEIPGAFYSGNGELEQFFIPNPAPGEYRIEILGLDRQVLGAVNSANATATVDEFLPQGEEMSMDAMVESVAGGLGDLDGDGDVDSDDRDLLLTLLNTFVNEPNHPGDIDGDGVLTTNDVDLLDGICTRPGCATGGDTVTCVPGSASMCLNASRFQVVLDWRDFQGNTGSGQVVPFGSDDSGLFWFFSADNWEMLVKVLDGCGINNRFWVFAAATTDVEYTLHVTDTLTGSSESYFNPLGAAASAITDTDAFATCAANRSATAPAGRRLETPRLNGNLGLSSAKILGKDLKSLVPKDHTCVLNTMACNSTRNGTLTPHDCAASDGTFLDFWEFAGTAGTDVTISLRSSDFDTFLVLLDPDIEVAAFDDDGGSGTNSRLVHRLTSSGPWTIAANNFAPGDLGSYTLSLSCSGAGSPPSAPSNLGASPQSSNSIALSWRDNSNDEDEFRVEARTTGGFQDIGSVPAQSTGAIVEGLQSATTYTFRVRARNQHGNSAYSNQASATTFAAPGVCVPSASNLCLNGERFKVEVTWRDFQGGTGSGTVVPSGSDDSGILWFFSGDNWEMLVKVLDGCGINDRYWVFSAATTDVEYTLRVTDTETGRVREYDNPLGVAADAITDTDAFATCP